MLQSAALGFGGLALADVVHAATNPTATNPPHFTPKAKPVIFLFMAGGPSQHDLFQNKKFIVDRNGQKMDSPLRNEVTQDGTEKFLVLGAMTPIRPRDDSGMMNSDLWPHWLSVADDICLLRGMNAGNPQHAITTNQLHTGVFTEVRTSMGPWFRYGLGIENQKPAYIRWHSCSWSEDLHVRFSPGATSRHAADGAAP